MSLRITPSNAPAPANVSSTAGSLGLHDTLQYGPRSLAAEIESTSINGGLKSRLDGWEETQDNLKLNLQRNVNGLHAPMRLLMERKMVTSSAPLPGMSRQSNIHLDILMGRDESLSLGEFFGGMDKAGPSDIHRDMEKKLKL